MQWQRVTIGGELWSPLCGHPCTQAGLPKSDGDSLEALCVYGKEGEGACFSLLLPQLILFRKALCLFGENCKHQENKRTSEWARVCSRLPPAHDSFLTPADWQPLGSRDGRWPGASVWAEWLGPGGDSPQPAWQRAHSWEGAWAWENTLWVRHWHSEQGSGARDMARHPLGGPALCWAAVCSQQN